MYGLAYARSCRKTHLDLPELEKEISMFKHTVLVSACLLATSMTAHAAVYDASFETNLGSQTFTTPLVNGDNLAITGLLDSGAGDVSNSILFTAGPNADRIDLDATWHVGAAGDALRMVGFNLDLLDASHNVVASDSFLGLLGGFAHSNLSFSGLVDGDLYELRVTATNTNTSHYILDAKLSSVPLPSAALLLGPALAGLSVCTRRRPRG